MQVSKADQVLHIAHLQWFDDHLNTSQYNRYHSNKELTRQLIYLYLTCSKL